ncbi:MAG: hypothetical protein KatS3mg085_033 [Candidatus Dojkabacteria bacterium]|nr:MAG: hypothetical protein KatS3mg085_033 [Candidatus Dojkabacteria bacterium]
MKKYKVSIIIVTWNSGKDIKTCLDSLFEQSFKDFKAIVVDNASQDDTVQKVEQYPEVDVIKQKKNYFLCKSNNDGIKYAIKNYQSEYVMVLNPDTKLDSNCLKFLIQTFNKNQNIGAVGPKIYFWNNPNEGKINSAGMIFDNFMQAYDRGFLEEDHGQYDKEEVVPALSGACILFKVEALKKVGLYWEILKMYLDDVEIALRLKKNGFFNILSTKSCCLSFIHGFYKAKQEVFNIQTKNVCLALNCFKTL